ncbi:hypothetical protein [Celeribacter neptunius]|nr:hypothetical protein [Celeribacter neptunius]
MPQNSRKAETPSPGWLWQIAYIFSFIATSSLCLLTAVYGTFARTIGHDAATLLTVTAVIATTLIGPKFRHFWASGPVHVIWAGLITSFLASGTALCVTQLAQVFFEGDPALGLVSLPVTFASAAFLVPISLYSNPPTILIWLGGSFVTSYCARRITRLERLREEHGNKG